MRPEVFFLGFQLLSLVAVSIAASVENSSFLRLAAGINLALFLFAGVYVWCITGTDKDPRASDEGEKSSQTKESAGKASDPLEDAQVRQRGKRFTDGPSTDEDSSWREGMF
mmetsp:Transcript_75190/g.141851  ORF Transcript_75190/g.141851 Transcript_75190/m.141851 type:complete len:111 (+) Transcript_75190:87-419(+)